MLSYYDHRQTKWYEDHSREEREALMKTLAELKVSCYITDDMKKDG